MSNWDGRGDNVHIQARTFVANTVDALKVQPSRVIEIGGRNINGTIRDLFMGAERYVAIDLEAGAGVDVVADWLEFAPAFVPDCIVCCEVLEHAPRAEAIVNKALRALAPGGVFIVTAAGPGRMPHSAKDGGTLRDGEHYENIEPHLLANWFAAVTDIDHSRVFTAPGPGDVYGVAIRADADADSVH